MSFSTRPLGEVARLLSGGTPRKSNPAYWKGRIPWLTPKDMGRWENQTEAHVSEQAIGNGTRLAPANASFIAVRGMSLHNEIRVIRCSRSITFNQDIKAVVAGPDLDDGFLYYALTAAKPTLFNSVSAAGHGTGVLATDRLLALPIPSIPMQTQRAIAKLFGDIDDKIELNRQMNETLEAQARALFRDWFVDFGPVKAKMAGDTPYLAPDLWSLFPNGLKDGVPEGWKTGVLSDLLVLQRGFDLPKTKRTDGPYPVIAASGPSGTHNESRVEGPGVCTGRSGVLGGVYYVESDFWPLNTSLWIKAYPNSTPLHAMFTLQEIDIAAFNAGSAVPTLNRNHIHQAPAAIPPMSVVEAFTSLASVCYAKISANEREGRILARVRDLLLPKLMSGEIRVGDVSSVELSAA